MKLVVFGLSVSSAWGNGHATLWRGLIKALVRRGHTVEFFERDEPFYASHRDFGSFKNFKLQLYGEWESIVEKATREVKGADAVIVTSYCRDALSVLEILKNTDVHPRVFYDLDTPVTLGSIRNGTTPFYIGDNGLSDYDLVISYTGGTSLDGLKQVLKAQRTVPLFGWVDENSHLSVKPSSQFSGILSYLGTYAQDRQGKLDAFFLKVAGKMPGQRFVIGGALYPEKFPFGENVVFMRHVPPSDHPSFYCSSSFTLNITRSDMATCGFCPSARIFEAAACGTPIISDNWQGLENFLIPGEEIVTVQTTADVIDALKMSESERKLIAHRARMHVLEEHTAYQRAIELEKILADAYSFQGAA